MVDDRKPKIPPPPLPGQKSMGRSPVTGGIKPPLPLPQKPGMPSAAGAVSAPSLPSMAASAAPASDLDGMRQQMESQINALQRQLHSEKEKMLLQTVRAKEEEVMAAKVEESLKDIQDRLRREKREQELQETLTKAENQIKELETRIVGERQTWVETLKTQLSQRESQDRDLENNFRVQLKELERRWHEEKLQWSQAVKSKDEEIARLRRDMETAVASERDAAEKRIAQIANERETLQREMKETTQLRQEERSNMMEKLENRDKEYLGIKAQQAMIVTQFRQEKEKADQLHQILEKMKAERGAMAAKYDGKEKEFFLFKTQFAMYQTRSKSEQERLLKEMVLFKEQIQKERQQFEITLRMKDNELQLQGQNGKEKESELKIQLEKKELELNGLMRQYEERIKAREAELRYIFEKKEAEYQTLIRQQEEKLSLKEQNLLQLMTQKDSEIKALASQWESRLAVKEKEIAIFFDREREYKVTIAQHQQQLFELREKVNAKAAEIVAERENAGRRERELSELVVRKDQLLEKEKAAASEKYQKKEEEIAKAQDREQVLKVSLSQYEQKLSSLEGQITFTAREAASDRERFVQREKELGALLLERENALKALDAKWAQKLEAREKELSAVVIAKDGELRQRDEKWADKIAAKEKELAISLEQEKTLRISFIQLEQKTKDLEESLRQRAEEIALGADNIAAKEKELAKVLEQEKTLSINLVQEEQKIKSLEESLRQRTEEIAQGREYLVQKDRELVQLGERFKEEKKAAQEKFFQEHGALLTQLEAARAEHARLLTGKDEQLKGQVQKGQELELRIRGLENEVERREKEIEKIKSDGLLREKDTVIEANRKEFVFKQESAALEEKINGLNTAIKEKEKEFQSRLDAREREWRKTEETLLAEKTVRDAALAALKYENETSLREKEALLREREQLQGTARSHMDDFERRLQIERDRAGEALRQKEQELAQLKAVHFEFEATIRREAEQKYRSQIERLEREKDEVSQGVAQEIQSLRRSLQAEMQGVEEQFGQERIELKNKLKEKENGIAELQEKLGETLQHLKSEQDRNQNTVSEGKRTWDVERTELLRQLQENRAALERLDNTYREQFSLRTPPTTPAQPVIIAVEEAVPAATHDVPVIDAADAGISRYISRFWQDINKPVIEINFKGDSETKN